MLVIFSSGHRARYLPDDILALPEGTSVQYRYRRDWIADSVLKRIDGKKLTGSECLLTFVDQADPTQAMTYVPLRRARVISAPPTVQRRAF
jgi:hypothetical protein